MSAQVAFLGMPFNKIPDWLVGRKRTGAETFLAPDAFLFINHYDVPVTKVRLERIYRTHGNTGGLHALSALGEENVIRPFSKTILYDLYS